MNGDIFIFIAFIGICMVASYRMGWRHAVQWLEENRRKEEERLR